MARSQSDDKDRTSYDVASESGKTRKLSVSQSPQQQQIDAAVETIFRSLGGPGWKRRENWLSRDHDLSQWQGITCSAIDKNSITVLELSQNNLRGRLDDPILVDAFIKLGPTLEQLWLCENALNGNLPSIFADASIFPRLNILDVGSNQLRGSLHPAFAKRAPQFSWLDTTGNQLTSYFRYTTSTNKNDQNNEEHVLVDSSSPLPDVHLVQSILSKQQCANLIEMAVQYTEANGGWMTSRHKAYETTDVDISICGGQLLDTCNDHVAALILPSMSHIFGFSRVDLAIEDLFLSKYSAEKGQQRMLPEHRDDSELSFVITLNDAFQGGGTQFRNRSISSNDIATEKVVVVPPPGAGVFFCGRQLHAGVEVIEGTRYILAGFVRVYPGTAEGAERLAGLLERTP